MLLQIKHVSLVCFLLNNEIQLLFFSFFFFLFPYLISNRPRNELYKTCERIKIDNKLTLQASNFTFLEELTLNDLASVSSSDEGIEIQQYIRKGHLWSADALEETLKAKVSTWSVIKQVLHALNAAWVIGTVIGVTVICYRLYRTYQQRKREGGLQGKVEAP